MINNKETIDGILVVEGKTDKDKILKLFDAQIITTNGSALNQNTINTIISLSKTNKIIFFLDPDYVGEQIRKKLSKLTNLDNIYHAFIKLNDIDSKSIKKGIAEASDESIKLALKNLVKFNPNNQSINLEQYHQLGLNTKHIRLWLCNQLKISYCNYKQLFKRLNMLNLSAKEIYKILQEYEK